MNIKKVVAAALILSSMTAVSASAAEFNDINGHWAEDIINELADKDIIHGVSDTEFNPDGTVTRAEFLKMALGTVGIADVPYRSGECLDVTASDWYGGCVQSALDKGLIPENMIGNYAAKITDGKAIYSGFFDGDKPIKREEMAYMVYMLYQYSCDEEESYNILTPVDLQPNIAMGIGRRQICVYKRLNIGYGRRYVQTAANRNSCTGCVYYKQIT